jgi:hypothetical protein
MGFVLAVMLAGCAGARSEDVSTPSSAPSGAANPEQAAQTALATANLRLPEGATGITVDFTGYEDFRHVALVKFVAPRSSVISMCERSGAPPKRTFSLADYEKRLLGGPPAQDDQLCKISTEYGRGMLANVLIPAGDPAQVRVSLFQLPVR